MTNETDGLLREATEILEAAGVEEARAEARRLLQWAAGCDRLGLLRLKNVPDESVVRFREGVKRRADRMPMAFITGERGFWSLDFAVSPQTLIPRPDSETLIEALLEARPHRENVKTVLDLGTGAGCLLLAALVEYPRAFGIGVDISPEAALLARENAARNHLSDRTAFLAADWTAALSGRVDVVLSNPPYIESAVVPGLMPEVARFEPHRALDGGADGLEAYAQICRMLPDVLAVGGCAVLELGVGQESAVTALARHAGLKKRACKADLGSIPRALVLERA